MARNGSGTYNLPAGNPVVTGTVISSTTHNTTMSDIATALTNSIAKDGQTVPTANLPMGGYKLTGCADAVAQTDGMNNRFTYPGTGSVARTVLGKLADVISVRDFGATGDGVADDTAAIQAAIDYAMSVGNIVVSGDGRTYAVSSQLTFDGAYGIFFRDISLIAIAGTWPTGSTGAVLGFVAPSVSGRHKLDNIQIDCDEIAKSGIYAYRVGAGTVFERINIRHFTEYGFHFLATGDGNNDVRVISCSASEAVYGDAKYNDYTLRTGVGFRVESSADMAFTNCTAGSCMTGLHLTGTIWNGVFTGCKFWNGTDAQARANSVVVRADSGVNRIQFIGCRFDDGSVTLYRFNHQFVGCQFIQYTLGALTLVASNANETADSLTVIGNIFEDDAVTLSTTGSGSWAGNQAQWIANRTSSGTSVLINGCSLIADSGYVRLKDTNGQFQIGNTTNATVSSGDSFTLGLSFHGTTTVTGATVGRWSADTSGPRFDTLKSRGAAVGTYSAVLSGDTLGTYTFSGAYGSSSGEAVVGVRLRGAAAGNWGANRPAKLAIGTVETWTSPVDRVIIEETGHMIPGADNAYNFGSGTYRWATIYAATGTINTSDVREKDAIADIPLGLDFVKSLHPVAYKWKVGSNYHTVRTVEPAVYDDDGNIIKEEVTEDVVTPRAGERTHLGLIAQEVKQALDAAGVDCAAWILEDKNNPDSRQGLRYDQFIPVLIKAVQELAAEIQALKK